MKSAKITYVSDDRRFCARMHKMTADAESTRLKFLILFLFQNVRMSLRRVVDDDETSESLVSNACECKLSPEHSIEVGTNNSNDDNARKTSKCFSKRKSKW